jgi:hypothetical protein
MDILQGDYCPGPSSKALEGMRKLTWAVATRRKYIILFRMKVLAKFAFADCEIYMLFP